MGGRRVVGWVDDWRGGGMGGRWTDGWKEG